jgi:enamine deaminase RidA (YjgF/YER057c/UK114 family)
MDKQQLAPAAGSWATSWHAVTSPGWRVGDWVIVGGQVAMDTWGTVVAVGDFEGQLRHVMSRIERVLAEAGATLIDVVSTNAFVKYDGPDAGLWDFWEYQLERRCSYFEAPGPAMTGIPVPRLGHPDLLIEIEALDVRSAEPNQP